MSCSSDELFFFFFKQKTAYEMRSSDWSSDVCSSDLMTKLTAADFASDQEVRWCPGCGDYAILKAVQRTMPEIGADPAKTVFVSGIGCSSRFPYYMATYGFHTIHGRAPAVATG